MVYSFGSSADHPSVVAALDSPGISYLGHATLLLELDGVRILTDPLLRKRTAHLRRCTRIETRSPVGTDLDVVLISHMHWDHLDIPSLRMLRPDTPVLGPIGSGQVLRRAGLTNITEMKVGEQIVVGKVAIEATPANHDGNRPPFGPNGEAIGFVVHGSSSIYFAGDTDLFDEMSSLASRIDIALLPVWGWGPSLGAGHLDPARAATALTRINPEYAVPIHWGTLCPIGLNWAQPQFLTQPPRDFVQAAGREAPDVNVQVVKPGGTLNLTPSY